jgi:ferredoxin
MAFIGVRSCDLHAIAVQDRVFTGGPCVDSHYRSRRDGAFLVAVNCGEPAATCFCVSMGTGPEADSGYDIVLTEIVDSTTHEFVAAAGSEAGVAVLGEIETSPAGEKAHESVRQVVDRTRSRMGRTLDTTDLKGLLYRNFDHPRWDDAAQRCLSCGNCTNVCPTCFCTTVEDHADLEGTTVERSRRWDSCFTLNFTHLHGGSVRSTVRARYRQWMTHKLATWWDQFGTSGCVGCGRCITWCPVGIDLTAEAAAIRSTDGQGRPSSSGKETGHGNQVA